MSKKNRSTSQKPFSEKSYLKSGQARKLPVYECFVMKDWEELQKTHVVVARQHKGGHITVALFLVDLLCAGVKDAYQYVNITKEEYHGMLEKFQEMDDLELESCDYVLAHNIVYGALDYAAEFGIDPPSEFGLASLVLNEDTEDIPLIELPLGMDGKPCLDIFPGDPRKSYYLKQLEKNVGPGNFEIMTPSMLDDEEDDDQEYGEEDLWEEDCTEWTRQEWDDFITGLEYGELMAYVEEANYIVRKCMVEPNAASSKLISSIQAANEQLKITSEPIEIGDLSDEEYEVMEKIHGIIISPESSTREIKSAIKEIEQSMQRWPTNPVFHNYHHNAYKRLGKLETAHEILRNTIHKFPDYLFGKMAYADSLLDQQKPAEALKVLGGHLDLQSAFPEREEFHTSEFIGFYTIICRYYMLKEDLVSVFAYKYVMDEFAVPGMLGINEALFLQLDLEAINEAQRLVDEAQQDKQKKEEMLDLLVTKVNGPTQPA